MAGAPDSLLMAECSPELADSIHSPNRMRAVPLIEQQRVRAGTPSPNRIPPGGIAGRVMHAGADEPAARLPRRFASASGACDLERTPTWP